MQIRKLPVDGEIEFREILLIGEESKKEIISTEEALKKAEDLNLDLCCVSVNSNPPVCKIMDYGKYLGKYLFEIGKKNKKKTKKISRKEIRIHSNTDKKDLETRIIKMKEWIKTGESVIKVTLFMIRREIEHTEIPYEKCKEYMRKIEEEIPNVEIKNNEIKKEGRRNLSFLIIKKSKQNI